MTWTSSRYRPELPVGRGGFSRVTRCIDGNLDRVVAVKELIDAADASRARDEVRALLGMRSRNVVQVFDLIPTDERGLAIVEEFVEGCDLAAHSRAELSVEAIRLVLWQLACGLADIHDAGFVHRDVTPANIRIQPDGVLKILDFGLARRVGEDSRTVGFKGTLYFAAPELCSAEEVTFGSEVDVYSFAMVSIYLTCGGVLPVELMRLPPLSIPGSCVDSLLRIGTSFTDVLLKAASLRPAERPTMKQLRAALEEELLRDKHQAIVGLGGAIHRLGAANRSARVGINGVGVAEVRYSGVSFIVTLVTGEVYVNNSPAVVGQVLPGSCVIVIGGPTRPSAQRAFITFDVSHPEVVL
jgi:serine/threonine protein kinase